MCDQCIEVHIVFQNTLSMLRTSFGTMFMLEVSTKNAPKSWLTLV